MPLISSLCKSRGLDSERRNASIRGDSKGPLSINLVLLPTYLVLLMSRGQQEESLVGRDH